LSARHTSSGQTIPYRPKDYAQAEINDETWATRDSDTSRPSYKLASGRIAVKVINHLGDEVMKGFRGRPESDRDQATVGLAHRERYEGH
jgi:hypothetical protein